MASSMDVVDIHGAGAPDHAHEGSKGGAQQASSSPRRPTSRARFPHEALTPLTDKQLAQFDDSARSEVGGSFHF